MSASQNPRRRPADQTDAASIDNLTASMNSVAISKASTYQQNSKQDSTFWDPFLQTRTGPGRSPTCPKALEDLLMGSGERRATDLITKVDKASTAAELSTILQEDEALPVINTATSATSSRRSSVNSLEDLNESDIDSLMSSPATDVSDDMDLGDDNSKDTARAEARVHRVLSDHARKQVRDYIWNPIVKNKVFKDYHGLFRRIPAQIVTGRIRTIRDLEKTIIFEAPDYSRSPNAYRSFCELTIRCLQVTVQAVHESDQCLPTERPYTPNYFVDLVEQIRRYAQILAATRAKQERGEALGPKDITMSDKVELRGGMSQNGKAAVLAVVKEEEVISLADNKPMTAEQTAAKRPLEDDTAARSMARRKKGEPRRSYPCPHAGCTKPAFNRPCDLTKHLKTHERPFKCQEPSCKFHVLGWPTEKERDRHFNDKHSLTPKLYSCPHCPDGQYNTKRESNLKQHLEQNHGIPYIRSKGNGKRKASAANTMAQPSPSAQTDSVFNSPLPQTALSPSVESIISADPGAQSVPFSPVGQTPFAFDFDFPGFGTHFNTDYLQPSPVMSAGPALTDDRHSSVATSVTDFSPLDMHMPDFDHTAFKNEPAIDYSFFNDPNFKQLADEVLASQYPEAVAGPSSSAELANFSPIATDPMINGVNDTEMLGGMNGDFTLFNNANFQNGGTTSFDELLELQPQNRLNNKQWNLFPELGE